MNDDRLRRDPSPRSSPTTLAGRAFGAIPPTALVLLGIVSVQLGSALAKHLFSAVGSFGAVALRLFFAAAVLLLSWRPSLRMNRRAWTVVLGYGVTCWGLYILLGAALGRHTTEGHGLALGMAVAALVAVPVGMVDSGAALVQPRVLVAGLGVALLSSVIPYSLDLEALRRMPPGVFGILMSLEPAMAALVGLVVLHESLRASQWIAVLCVVASAGATRGARPDV